MNTSTEISINSAINTNQLNQGQVSTQKMQGTPLLTLEGNMSSVANDNPVSTGQHFAINLPQSSISPQAASAALLEGSFDEFKSMLITNKDAINMATEAQQRYIQENEEALAKAIKEQDKASKSHSWLTILSWVGVGIAVVAAAVAVVATGGAAGALVACAAAGLAVGLQVMNTTGATAKLTKDMGSHGSLIMGIGTGVLSLVLAAASIACANPFGVVDAVANLCSSGSTAAEAAGETAGTAANIAEDGSEIAADATDVSQQTEQATSNTVLQRLQNVLGESTTLRLQSWLRVVQSLTDISGAGNSGAQSWLGIEMGEAESKQYDAQATQTKAQGNLAFQQTMVKTLVQNFKTTTDSSTSMIQNILSAVNSSFQAVRSVNNQFAA